MVILATAATIIASQALISGTFTLIEQAIALNLSPRMLVRHTSYRHKGQVFVPAVNLALAIGCAVLVVAFKSSDRLASAYGLAVGVTMLCTSLAYFNVITRVLHWNRVVSVGLVVAFLGRRWQDAGPRPPCRSFWMADTFPLPSAPCSRC